MSSETASSTPSYTQSSYKPYQKIRYPLTPCERGITTKWCANPRSERDRTRRLRPKVIIFPTSTKRSVQHCQQARTGGRRSMTALHQCLKSLQNRAQGSQGERLLSFWEEHSSPDSPISVFNGSGDEWVKGDWEGRRRIANRKDVTYIAEIYRRFLQKINRGYARSRQTSIVVRTPTEAYPCATLISYKTAAGSRSPLPFALPRHERFGVWLIADLDSRRPAASGAVYDKWDDDASFCVRILLLGHPCPVFSVLLHELVQLIASANPSSLDILFLLEYSN